MRIGEGERRVATGKKEEEGRETWRTRSGCWRYLSKEKTNENISYYHSWVHGSASPQRPLEIYKTPKSRDPMGSPICRTLGPLIIRDSTMITLLYITVCPRRPTFSIKIIKIPAQKRPFWTYSSLQSE